MDLGRGWRLVVVMIGIAVATSGCRLYAWGGNGSGQLGLGPPQPPGFVSTPTPVGSATDWRVVSAARFYSCGVHEDGSLWCWGENQLGQLGDGTIDDRHEPTQVGTATDWRFVTATDLHTCGIRNDGSLWCWGQNSEGQASGDGTTSNGVVTPMRVGNDSWKTVRAGSQYTCAIRTDSTLWCWGANFHGQLGDGTITDRSTPVQIGTATWTALSAGYAHTCGIQANRSLWCWGENDSGQVGNGTTNLGVLRPIQVGTATDWRAVTTSVAIFFREGHTCAIRDGGSLWCWGQNSEGQLGDGTLTRRLLPVPIGAETWRAVDAGEAHTCAVRADSTLWCWGFNNAGQVGDGTTSTRNAPVQAGSLNRWFTVSTGSDHTLGLLLPE
jgi:alpha-tubulin suppressor-like RCC1 family protein